MKKSFDKKIEQILNFDSYQYCERLYEDYKFLISETGNADKETMKRVDFTMHYLLDENFSQFDHCLFHKYEAGASFEDVLLYHLKQYVKSFSKDSIRGFYEGFSFLLDSESDRLNLVNVIEKIRLIQEIYHLYQMEMFKNHDGETIKNNDLKSENNIHLTNSHNNGFESFPQIENTKNKEQQLWFLIGVKLATGELQKLYNDNNQNARKTADDLGNLSFRPYISESMPNTNKTDKNIFKRKQSDINLIIDYCQKNNLTICDDFKTKTSQINTIK